MSKEFIDIDNAEKFSRIEVEIDERVRLELGLNGVSLEDMSDQSLYRYENLVRNGLEDADIRDSANVQKLCSELAKVYLRCGFPIMGEITKEVAKRESAGRINH